MPSHTVRVLCEARSQSRSVRDAATNEVPFFWRGSSVVMQLGLTDNGAHLLRAGVGTIIVEVKALGATSADDSLMRAEFVAADCDATFTAADWAGGAKQLLAAAFTLEEAAIAPGTYRLIVRHVAPDESEMTYLSAELRVLDPQSGSEGIDAPPVAWSYLEALPVVRTDITQTLTELQKTRALANIGAAGVDVLGEATAVNSQPFCLAKISGWSSSAQPPIRGAIKGDSLSLLGPLRRGPLMADAGSIGYGIGSSTGTVTATTTDFASWFTGITTVFAAGSSAQFSCGDSAPTHRRGNKLVIYYLKKSGGGTFDIQYESASAIGTWTTATGGAAISAANATTIGAVFTADLPISNTPSYKIRINNVTGGGVTIIGAGIYHSTGGGCIMVKDLFCKSGLDLSAITVPSAIYTPILTDLALDFILTCWADGTDGASAPWDVGGLFRTWYANFKAIKAETDWIVISANPASVETWHATVRASQRAWAIAENQSYINGHSMFRSYANAVAMGMMQDTIHLSTTGGVFRNNIIATLLPLFQIPLGGMFTMAGGGEYSPFVSRGIGDFGENSVEFGPNLTITGSTAELFLCDQATPLNLGLRCSLAVTNGGLLYLKSAGTNVMVMPTGATGFFGLSPTGTGYKLGGYGGFNWDANLRNTVNTGTFTFTPDAQTATTAAVSITTASTKLTTTAPAQAITLANGVDGQIKTIAHVASSGGGTAVLTPATKTGYSTITFTNVGETATLQYFTSVGWLILSLRGAVAA